MSLLGLHAAKESNCHECGQAIIVTGTGITHHVTVDGAVDHDQDADHVALDEHEFEFRFGRPTAYHVFLGLQCGHCSADLAAANAVTVSFLGEDRMQCSAPSCVKATGELIDPNGQVRTGKYTHATCQSCGEDLEDRVVEA